MVFCYVEVGDKVRYMGLDFGSKTVGVAVSDPFGWTAQPIETVERKDEANLVATIGRLAEIIEQYSVEAIVLGLPKNMNNTEGERVAITEKFERRLIKEFGLEVIMWDERLSTLGAARVLDEANMRKRHQKKVIDKLAAVFILQGYLDTKQ